MQPCRRPPQGMRVFFPCQILMRYIIKVTVGGKRGNLWQVMKNAILTMFCLKVGTNLA